MSAVPPSRLATCNAAPIDPKGEYVLYWMIAARRAEHSFALDRAVELAEELGKPLVILEALRVGYRWASDRLHRFVLDGHPTALSWIGAVRGHRVKPLGVEHFGQSGTIPDLFHAYGIDANAIALDERNDRIVGCGLTRNDFLTADRHLDERSTHSNSLE